MPDDIDPNSVHLCYSSDAEKERTGVCTVSYRIKDVLFWRLLELSEITEEGNILNAFTAHVKGNFERGIGFDKVNTTAEVLEL